MPITKNKITYSRKKIITVLKTLNELVVSLDQIGSASYDMTKTQNDAALSDFINRHKIFKKIAQARRILSAPFDKKLGADEMEREMKGVKYWNDLKKK